MKAMFCPNCGGPVSDKAKFCSHCGASLTQPEEAAPPAPVSLPSDPPEFAPQAPRDSVPAAPSQSPETSGQPDGQAPEEASPFSDLLRRPANSISPSGSEPPAGDAPPTGFYGGPAEPGTPPPDLPDAPMEPPPRRRKRVVAAVGIAAAVVLVAAGVLAAFLFFFNSSPKAQLAVYMGNTWSAIFPKGSEDGFFAVLSSGEDRATRQTWNLRLGKDLTEMLLDRAADTFLGSSAQLSLSDEDMENTGISVVREQDLANRKLSLSLSGNLGEFQVDALRLFLDDGLLSVGSPDFLGDRFYAVNTETLSEDLSASPLGSGLAAGEELNFNYFDLLAQAQDGNRADVLLSPDTLSALRDLYTTWQETVTVEKGNAGEVEVNGSTLTCTSYTMTVPAPALRQFLTDSFALLEGDSSFRVWMARLLLNSAYGAEDTMAMDPEAYWQQNRQNLYDWVDLFSNLFQEDLVLVFQVADKQVRRVSGTFLLNNGGYTLSADLDLQFGTEESIANSLSALLTLDAEYGTLQMALTSSGNHVPQDGGSFTDFTTFTVSEDGTDNFTLTAQTRYDSAQTADNFSFSCQFGDGYGEDTILNLEGTVLSDVQAGTASVDLDTLSFSTEGYWFSMAYSWSMEPLDSFSFQPDSPTMLLSMSQDDLNGIPDLAKAQLDALAERFYTCFPEAYVEPFNPGDFVLGALNAIYLGDPDPYFLEQSGYTQADAQSLHQEKLNSEPDYFFQAFTVEYPTDALREQFAGLYGQLYSMARYQIDSITQWDDDTYVVSVAVEPMDAIQQMYDQFPAFSEAFEAQFDEAALAAMSQAEWEDWYINVYDAQYGQGLAGLMSSVLAAGVGYGDTEYVDVYVTRNSDGTWSADENSLWNVDLTILPY